MGHLKTVVILAGGFLLFQEAMAPKKLAGIVLGMSGIVWRAPLGFRVEGFSLSPEPYPVLLVSPICPLAEQSASTCHML